MTDPESGSDDLGVVDPIRAPKFLAVLWRRLPELPLYALGFVLAAVIRTALEVADWVAGPSADAEASIVGLVLGSLPGSIFLLIPVAVAWSMQARGATSVRVIRGSVAVGLSELVRIGATFIFPTDGSTGLAYGALDFAASFLLGGGLVWMAHGLEELRQVEPSTMVRRAGLGVAVSGAVFGAVILAVGLISLISRIPGPGSDQVEEALFILAATELSGSLIATLGWAYLAWVLIRGVGDPNRPRSATGAGAVSGSLAGTWFVASEIALLIHVVPFLTSPNGFELERASGGLGFALSLIAAACRVGAIGALAWGLVNGLAFDAEAEAEYRDQDEATNSAR